MKIGIHHSKGSYSEGWIDYCKEKGISYKIVDAYHTDIVKHLEDCDAFMWHHQHVSPTDTLFAKQLLFSLEQAGKVVFPNTLSTWHFDDKLGQKYLLEALNLPLINSFAFYSKEEALEWASRYQFPAVFKLRGGAGSANVRLAKNRQEAVSLIKKAFGKGFRQYDPTVLIKDAVLHLKNGEGNIRDIIKALAHYFYPYQIEKAKSREKGYVYFQEFIPDCKFDIRVQIVGDKCYAMARSVRKNDFRASGSGVIDLDGSKIPVSVIKLSFEIAEALKVQSLAIDFVPFNDTYLIAEICYAWGIAYGELDYGYWDSNLIWHQGRINPFEWMVELVLNSQK